MFKAKTSRSPLKAKPLRVAGQSLDRQIDDLLDDQFVGPYMVVVFLWLFAGLEWHRYLYQYPPNPSFYTVLAVGVTIYIACRMRPVVRQIRAMKLGRDGERAVAELLERTREYGFRVFHDIPGRGFNVDHLLVGRKGMFAIETKTITKPPKGKPVVEFDGESVRVGGHTLDRNAVTQATAVARWVKDLVRESTGRDVDVRPVVLFPGWFVENKAGKNCCVWVLEPKALASFIEHEPDRMSSEEVHLVSFHISRYIRSEQEKTSE